MNIHAEKISLIEWITRLNDTSIIEKLKEMQENYSKSSDWWNFLKKEEIESINRGLEDFEEGRTHSHETANLSHDLFFDLNTHKSASGVNMTEMGGQYHRNIQLDKKRNKNVCKIVRPKTSIN